MIQMSGDIADSLQEVRAFYERVLRKYEESGYYSRYPLNFFWASTNMQDMRNMIILRTRENIYVNAHLAQLTRQLADIDVHPARILAAQRRERTGVIGKHCDS